MNPRTENVDSPLPSAAPEVIPIPLRKYPNRRMYWTGGKRYVTQAEILQWVTQGKRVVVHEKATGVNVTVPVLIDCLTHLPRDRLLCLFSPASLQHSIQVHLKGYYDDAE